MDPLYPILVVAFSALVIYAVSAREMVRRNGASPNAAWSLLKWPTWVAVATTIVTTLGVAGALALVVSDMSSDGGYIRVLVTPISIVVVGAFYVYLVHPVLKVLLSHRSQRQRGQ